MKHFLKLFLLKAFITFLMVIFFSENENLRFNTKRNKQFQKSYDEAVNVFLGRCHENYQQILRQEIIMMYI